MSNSFTVTQHETLYRGRVFTIVRDEITHSSGYHAVREVVQHDGGAVVVALFENRDVLLIRQFRYPLQQEIFELPAGKLNPGEDPLECARRELEEETGWRASSLEKLTALWTTPGFCSEVLHIYLATGLEPGTLALEEGEESITVLRVPLDEALRMCATMEIADGKTIAGLTLAGMKMVAGDRGQVER
jgi:ADP-ribose pyrophosphatase